MKRRDLLLASGATLLLGLKTPAHALAVVAVRVWPAPDYTRVAIEHDTPGLSYKTHLLTAPDRLVVDLEGLSLNPTLRDLVARIQANDPYIAQVRVGQFLPTTVRLVFDLKQTIRPSVFTLPPVAQYQHRLVLDLYPIEEQDPLLAFLKGYEEQQASTPSPTDPPVAARGPAQVHRLVTVALDPGHGGEDPGAIGRRGTREKDVVLRIARLLKKEIDREPGMRAFLTRDGDYFVPLSRRVQKARQVRADLMVSIHADAWVSPKARGSSVYALSDRGATSAAARWMAQKENSADGIGGIRLMGKDSQLAQTLLDMSTTAQIKDSLKLGQSVLGQMKRVNSLHKQQVEQAGFAVLRAPDIPSILVETAFISNPQEEQRLRDHGYQQEMARALASGIKAYFAQNPPLAKSRMM
ncbi:MAG: N-acetylmuramoyl-L-alanine amidase [Burkholderiaceae bacterium]|nr:N-acetylmuramoyl-L-alanine amidase [Burkholderiaceae bacterium]